ncbi:MAG: bifunctional metallophosphatase/5'-nucleotidase [Segetibacter sp.]|nr:bifunctional metallophosphatase/5'-nucleotidase [Segetibacter sp.]
MKQTFRLLTFILFIATASCKTIRNARTVKDDGKIEVVLVQVNDVYEIAPVAGGKQGGMARVSTLKKQYLKTNPNTFLVMSGDFVSPSVYNSLQYNGKRIRGAQMIEAMNSAGMDFVCFGNHEFDINENELQDRINESEFMWISSNAFHKTANGIVSFSRTSVPERPPVSKSYIRQVKDKDGTVAKIGFIGVVLPANPAEYVSYTDPWTAAKEMYDQIKDSVDAVVAITHLTIANDERLAKEVPGLAAILGGHEHDMRFKKTGNVYITKAHSNARSAYVVKLNLDKNKKETSVTPELKYLNESVALDSNTNVVVQKWKKIAEDNYASLGFNPMKVVMTSGEPLEARETEIRHHPTNYSKLITEAMANACPQADVVVFNSGSIRLDDILTPPVTQYDIIRSMPFGGGIREVDMKGSLLLEVLQAGLKNEGEGGYLQYQPVIFNQSSNKFTINNAPVDPKKNYRVAMPDFLFLGREQNLGFLNDRNPLVLKVYPAETSSGNPKSDIRLAVIKYLEKKK